MLVCILWKTRELVRQAISFESKGFHVGIVTVFRFGGEMKKESSEKLILPCNIAGRKGIFQTDRVDSDIPLLLSKTDMKRSIWKMTQLKYLIKLLTKEQLHQDIVLY